MKKKFKQMFPLIGNALSHNCGGGCSGGACGNGGYNGARTTNVIGYNGMPIQTLAAGSLVGPDPYVGTVPMGVTAEFVAANGNGYVDGCGPTYYGNRPAARVYNDGGRFTPSVRSNDYCPEKFGTLRFRAVIPEGSSITRVAIPDATGIAAFRGDMNPETTLPFTFANGMPIDSMLRWLQTNAIAICGFRLSSSNPQNLGNLVNIIHYNLNNTTRDTQIDNSVNQNPNNPNTGLTVANCGWIHKFNDGLFVDVTADPDEDTTLDLTLTVARALAYSGPAWSNFSLPICEENNCG